MYKAELFQLARLNLAAGIKAKRATAYEHALEYLGVGNDLLPEDSWEKRYELARDFHLQLGECEYIHGNFDVADSHLDEVLDHAQTRLEKLQVYNVKLPVYTNNDQHHRTAAR